MDDHPAAVGINKAALTIISSNISKAFTVFKQSEECDGCPLLKNVTIGPQAPPHTLLVDTKFPTRLVLMWHKTFDQVCNTSLNQKFDENQNYTLSVQNDTGIITCSYDSTTTGQDPYMPILWATLFYLGLSMFWVLGKALYRFNFFRSPDAERLIISDLGSPDDPNLVYHLSVSTESASPLHAANTARRRLRSLDTFRGIALVLMIFVNYGGGKYWFFAHSTWNGLTFADLVFPWFMWIMGVSLALSVHSLLRRATPKLQIFWKISKRSAILFVLGLVVNTIDGYHFGTLRVMGVLQRFAVVYFIVATLEVCLARMNDTHLVTWWACIRDILVYWPQWIFMALVVAIHTFITFFLPVPGCPRGYLGPGGRHDNGKYFNCTGGAAGYVDRVILSPQHMYPHPTCKKIYDTDMPYDPEGLLGILTSTFLVFLGLQGGKILIFYVDHKARLQRWMLWALITGVAGIALCEASKNDGWIPLNKNLWSLSFILIMAGTSFILLSLCYIMVDVKHWWSGAPFFYPGMNPIVLYVGHEAMKGVFPWGWSGCASHGCFFGLALWGTSLWVIIAFGLYRNKWFIAV